MNSKDDEEINAKLTKRKEGEIVIIKTLLSSFGNDKRFDKKVNQFTRSPTLTILSTASVSHTYECFAKARTSHATPSIVPIEFNTWSFCQYSVNLRISKTSLLIL